MKKAFTLAETMITLVIIGTLAVILMPTLLKAGPEQAELRAKKAYNTIHRVVESFTTSGPYDLSEGVLDSSRFVYGTNDDKKAQRLSFFCNAVADLLNTRDVNCSYDGLNSYIVSSSCSGDFFKDDGSRAQLCLTSNNGKFDFETLRNNFDASCEAFFEATDRDDFNIRTADNVLWTFQRTNFTSQSYVTVDYVTVPSFYNVICIDTDSHKHIENIYGLGINKDGKLVPGAKLQKLVDQLDEEF